jgi:hypothetical protein
MSSLPLSPPLNASSSSRLETSTADNAKRDDHRRMKPELSARLKAHAITTRSTHIPSNAVFKKPALPSRREITAAVGIHDIRAETIEPKHRSTPASNQSLTRVGPDADNPSSMAHSTAAHPVRKPPSNTAEGLGDGSTGRNTGQPLTDTSILRKDNVEMHFGFQNAAQLELRQRVNKHVNAYLKKACGIAGGYKLHTERQAWSVNCFFIHFSSFEGRLNLESFA